MISPWRKTLLVAQMCLLVSFAGATVWADQLVHTWDLTQLNDLPHQYYYTYGIDWTPAPDQEIAWARLTIKNVYDWTVEADHLYVHLLESAPLGKRTYWDGQSGGDNFAGQGLFLIDWHDPVGGHPTGYDLVIDIPETHFGWLTGNFGFGFDPDCHYYNEGVELEIGLTPEPTTFALLSVSGLALGAMCRRRKPRT